jgi:hypothetical protein
MNPQPWPQLRPSTCTLPPVPSPGSSAGLRIPPGIQTCATPHWLDCQLRAHSSAESHQDALPRTAEREPVPVVLAGRRGDVAPEVRVDNAPAALPRKPVSTLSSPVAKSAAPVPRSSGTRSPARDRRPTSRTRPEPGRAASRRGHRSVGLREIQEDDAVLRHRRFLRRRTRHVAFEPGEQLVLVLESLGVHSASRLTLTKTIRPCLTGLVLARGRPVSFEQLADALWRAPALVC